MKPGTEKPITFVPQVDGADLEPKFPPPRSIDRQPSSVPPRSLRPRRPHGQDLPYGASGHCTLCVFTVSAKAETVGRAGRMVKDGIDAHVTTEHPPQPASATGAGS